MILVPIPLKHAYFSARCCLRRAKINKKRPWLAQLVKTILSSRVLLFQTTRGRPGDSCNWPRGRAPAHEAAAVESKDMRNLRPGTDQYYKPFCHNDPLQCDQIGLLIELWAIFQSLWQQLFGQNSQHFKAIRYCKSVRIFHFSSENHFWATFIDIGRLYTGHADPLPLNEWPLFKESKLWLEYVKLPRVRL